MKRSLLDLVLLAFCFVIVQSACPNACSGNGICGQHDSCICYSNFQGGDCSERICLFGKAWVNSPNGDINLDGDMYDSTQYSDDFKFASSAYYLTTDASPGGTWEFWPSFYSTSKDEGHHYMECSNRGTCNRDSGLCQCFPGYEGTACIRRSCTNACSANGICLSVNQILADYNTENQATRKYELWDGDMSRVCKCDAGYSGADCSQKLCPKGDDPLTTQFQKNEVQWVEIKSTEVTAGSDGLGGTASFTFTDEFGSDWKTDPIDIMAYDGSTTAELMASKLEAAIENLPGKVVKDVSVSVGYCEDVLTGHFLGYDASNAVANGYASGTNPAGAYLRCPQASAVKEQEHLVVFADDISVYSNPFAGDGTATHEDTAKGTTAVVTGAADVTCHRIVYPECVRFRVEFISNAGDLPLLQVDSTEITMTGKTMTQDSAVGIETSVVDQLVLVDDADGEATFGYDFTADEVVDSTDDDGIITPSAKTITFGSADNTNVVFPINTKIGLYCTENSIEHYLGQYTCASTTDSAATITVKEYISAPNSLCATADAGFVKVIKITEYISTNVDLTNVDISGTAIEFSHFGGEEVRQLVSAVQFDAATGTGQILLDGSTSLTQSVASASGKMLVHGVGTKENAECSDRGLCNSGTGLCQCFRGYKGEACNIQDALAQ